ncbi:MAG: GuaB3 family IMP dehydrogenase-related protein [Elusimicrobia bacterium]|nr:GuaB3 family IMP dehydrogenase-related protein [Elusimicrobiota bacterium]MBP9127488.1 GuaB3 family IMP dehydrogenase-related protein [Elusimicrobiota bacterium]
MAFFIGRDREARRAYGFDEVALVPGTVTVNPEDTDVSTRIGSVKLQVPILASAMDGVVDVEFAVAMGRLGGLAVLNLDGVQTRYENPKPLFKKISEATPEEATRLVQEIYKEPFKEKLVAQRVKEIKAGGALCAVSSIPQNAEKVGKIAADAGADLFVVQGTVTTARFKSSKGPVVDLAKFCERMKIPVIIGNVVTYSAALELMETGVSALLVGVGPGAACTSRGVLGLGVPQVTATIDCAAARDFYFKKTGRYVTIITDGGMTTGGDVCKAFASGADAVMVGSVFARAEEAPGRGFHWGMATPHHNLPRGTRVRVGTVGSLKQILFGPASLDDGTQNFVGAIRTCMGAVGATTMKEFQLTEIIIAPEIKHEGKLFQQAQKVGMGKK